jgi:glutathione peroxidase-family protein
MNPESENSQPKGGLKMTLYDYAVPKTDGTELSLGDFRGKVVARFEPTADMAEVEQAVARFLAAG